MMSTETNDTGGNSNFEDSVETPNKNEDTGESAKLSPPLSYPVHWVEQEVDYVPSVICEVPNVVLLDYVRRMETTRSATNRHRQPPLSSYMNEEDELSDEINVYDWNWVTGVKHELDDPHGNISIKQQHIGFRARPANLSTGGYYEVVERNQLRINRPEEVESFVRSLSHPPETLRTISSICHKDRAFLWSASKDLRCAITLLDTSKRWVEGLIIRLRPESGHFEVSSLGPDYDSPQCDITPLMSRAHVNLLTESMSRKVSTDEPMVDIASQIRSMMSQPIGSTVSDRVDSFPLYRTGILNPHTPRSPSLSIEDSTNGWREVADEMGLNGSCDMMIALQLEEDEPLPALERGSVIPIDIPIFVDVIKLQDHRLGRDPLFVR
eukprot:GHVH01017513.1.p1 GENE.GHVH01017513.1~~GHVH01017513.1.p1  ORF type:complete len:381 (+),score=56.31 GHVH01017513.1:34-1176(+)